VELTLDAAGCRVRVDCGEGRIAALLAAVYGGMQRPSADADLRYVATAASPSGLRLSRGGQRWLAADEADFLALFETDLSIALQRRRPDLLFLHSAVVEWEGRAVLLAGASGSGKSTATWGLVHEGFGYLSDELGPVDPVTLDVVPYPRAVCLKTDPPAPYRLPAGTLRTSRTLHVPAGCLPGGVRDAPLPLGAIFFVGHAPSVREPDVEAVSRGEAVARLLAHALNPLAHAGAGLDAATAITAAAPAFRLRTGALPATAAAVRATLGAALGAVAVH
jgi:hypothetical protein